MADVRRHPAPRQRRLAASRVTHWTVNRLAGVRRYKALHLFCGSGGGALGFKEAGFGLAGAIDIDPRCAIDFAALVGEAATIADIESMTAEQLRLLVPECPDVVFLSAPCDGFSGCNSEARSKTEKYQRLNRLALHGVRLVLMAWGERQPRAILFENVPRITTRGADLLTEITLELSKAGYKVDQRSHDCGEIGGLGQSRKRFLLLARDPETMPEPIRKPPKQRMRSIGEVIEEYPVPRPYECGDPMHVLQPLSALNWLRLACILAGCDWRTLPESVEIVVCETEEVERISGVAWGPCEGRHAGKLGVEDPSQPSHTRTGKGRPCEGWNAVADARVSSTDPRVPWDPSKHKGRPGNYGVAEPDQPSITVRGRHEIQNCEATVPDPRVAATAIKRRKGRHNGGFGIVANDAPGHTVVTADVANTWSSVQDTRLGCTPRNGAFGVADGARASGTVLGAHDYDNAQGSVADVRIKHQDRPRGGSRGAYEVQAAGAPSKTVLGHFEIRQAPGAVEDRRVAGGAKLPRRDRPRKLTRAEKLRAALTFDEQGWVVPTHKLVRRDDGTFVLYGPRLDFKATAAKLYLCIEAPDGTWHRALTLRELAGLQSVPRWFNYCGPRTSTETGTGATKRNGNMVPRLAALAIAKQVLAALIASDTGQLGLDAAGGAVWVRREEAAYA